jgi:hypothetical protein
MNEMVTPLLLTGQRMFVSLCVGGGVVSSIVLGGVQLGPIGTTATNRPIVPALGDHNVGETGGMIIDRGKRSTQRKTVPVPLCPPQHFEGLKTKSPNIFNEFA